MASAWSSIAPVRSVGEVERRYLPFRIVAGEYRWLLARASVRPTSGDQTGERNIASQISFGVSDRSALTTLRRNGTGPSHAVREA
jgi:hypothetical protein